MLSLQIKSPTSTINLSDIELIRLPTKDGIIAVLPRHSNMIIQLEEGVVEAQLSGGKVRGYFVSNGFAKMMNGECILFAQEIHSLESQNVRELLKQLIIKLDLSIKQSNDEVCRELFIEKRTIYEKILTPEG